MDIERNSRSGVPGMCRLLQRLKGRILTPRGASTASPKFPKLAVTIQEVRKDWIDRVLASCCQHFRKLSFWRVSRTAKRSVRGVKTTDMPIPPKIAFAVLACLPRESPPLPIEPRLHKIRVVHRGVIRPSFRSVNEKRTTVFGRPSVC